MSSPAARVEAGGGIVVAGDGRIAVVHRPRRDWTLPKGKLEVGESPLEAAVREVREETGLEVEVVRPAPTARYVDQRGRPKRVRYFEMRLLGGTFTANPEVDRLEWWSPEDASARLTYRSDRDVVRAWAARRSAGSAQEAAGAGRGG